MNGPSPEQRNPQTATVLGLGKAMKGWDRDSGSGFSTTQPRDIPADLPPLVRRTISRLTSQDFSKL